MPLCTKCVFSSGIGDYIMPAGNSSTNHNAGIRGKALCKIIRRQYSTIQVHQQH